MQYFIGAYASSPNVNGWDAELEQSYYQQLKQMQNIRGLEHPFTGKLHAHDEQWFLHNIDPNWQYILTCMPGVMGALSNNPNFGLASSNEAGRQQAVDFMQAAHDAVLKLNKASGKPVVKAILLHSAPNQSNAKSDATAFKTSLATISAWDWQGAELVVEHCDAFTKLHAPSKGFMSLDDEIQVLTELNAELSKPISMLVNWGRSVLEKRDVRGAVEHIQAIQSANLLKGIMFSGVSGQQSEYGAWKDTHMPPASDTPNLIGEASSLLTQTQIRACLEAACISQHDDLLLGVKLGIRPVACSTQQRVRYNKDALNMIDNCLK